MKKQVEKEKGEKGGFGGHRILQRQRPGWALLSPAPTHSSENKHNQRREDREARVWGREMIHQGCEGQIISLPAQRQASVSSCPA